MALPPAATCGGATVGGRPIDGPPPAAHGGAAVVGGARGIAGLGDVQLLLLSYANDPTGPRARAIPGITQSSWGLDFFF